jgi:hypothetical protein
MKKNVSKLQSTEQLASEQQQETQTQATHQFASAEELLRFDASRVTPPARIIDRLQDSLAQEPAVKRSWWRRWFCRE